MTALHIILMTLVACAFSSGMEIAFVSANKLRIELDKKQGKLSALIVSRFVKSPSRFIGTMLIANNIALVIYSMVFSEDILPRQLILDYLPHGLRSELAILIVQTFIPTLIILIAAEFIPKTLFRINPNSTLNILAIPALAVYYLLFPLVILVISLSRFLLNRVFKIEFAEERPVFARIDLDLYLRDLSTKNSQVEEMDTEIRIFRNALDFNEVKVRECMVPRKELVAISVDESIAELQKMFIETKLSKILIYRDSIDNIIGFTHSSEIFKKPKDILSILLPISIVPEVMPANELLTLFTNHHRSIALVVDEFGGTSGMVTMEDVIEEIFGEIQDEHDDPENTEKQLASGEYIFSGRLEIDYLNKKYEFNLPEDEAFETLAGFIVHHHENIPEPGEEIFLPPYVFKIIQVKDNRIEQVKMRKDDKEK
jgi:CBS domain containing-hemolysin-like protein